MKSCGRIVWSSILLLVLLSLHGAICDGKALYASKVIEVSSEYSQDHAWSANRILGPPDVWPNLRPYAMGYNWSPLSGSTQDFIEVEFPEIIKITKIEVYVSASVEHITKISVLDRIQNSFVTVYEATATAGRSSEVLTIESDLDSAIYSDVVRIDSDSSNDDNWLQIDAIKISGGEPIQLYASRVKSFSSEWSSGRWSANRILGAPDVWPNFGANSNNWSPQSKVTQDFIEVEFPGKIEIKNIEVYVAVSVEHITKVSVFNINGSSFVTVYEATAMAGTSSQILTIDLDSAIYSDVVRIDSDSSNDDNWLEIDAIKISGEEPEPEPKQLYASRVKSFSSEYSSSRWSANKILRPPDVWPNFADDPNNWSPLSKFTQDFIEVEFPEIIKITNIEVYVAVSVEHITKISVLDRIQTSFVTVYEATATAGMSNEVLTIDLDSAIYSDVVRIDSDSSNDNNWLEIDAIKISGSEPKQLYASRVKSFSSEWSSSQYSAHRILGAPDVWPNFGANSNNWSPLSEFTQDFIEVEFPEIIRIINIEVYVAVSVEHITEVSVLNGSSFATVYEATATAGRSSEVLTIDLDSAIYSDVVRIDSDSSNDDSWLEIDAIKIIGGEGPELEPGTIKISGGEDEQLIAEPEPDTIKVSGGEGEPEPRSFSSESLLKW